MASLKALDDLVKKEIKKIKLRNGFTISFTEIPTYPGQGSFEIKGKLNDADLRYCHSYHSISGPVSLTLMKDGDSIIINADAEGINSVTVNDRRYDSGRYSLFQIEDTYKCVPAYSENDLEKEDAFEFGRKALEAAKRKIALNAPGALELIEGYCSRTLLPPEENPNLRTNAEIFAKFKLD
ncbi:MAG: hypothetical protein QXT19_03610 [Candidatus Woesearchaeota archaeon]